jgi:predicted ester cyclase
VVDEVLWTGHIADGRFFGLAGKSGQVTFRLLHVFEFRDGLISRENVWSDIAGIAQQVD